jgi:Rrf2 family protein
MSANTRFAVAVHLLVALAFHGDEGCTSEELARSVTTNPVVVRRLLGVLTKAGLVSGRGGRSGGYSLARKPERITLEQVFRAVEPAGVLALHENPTNQACVVSCEIKGLLGSVFADAQKALEARLKKTSVADLLADARSGG